MIVAVIFGRVVHARSPATGWDGLRDGEGDGHRHVAFHPELDSTGVPRVVGLPRAKPLPFQDEAHSRAPGDESGTRKVGGVAAGVPPSGDHRWGVVPVLRRFL